MTGFCTVSIFEISPKAFISLSVYEKTCTTKVPCNGTCKDKDSSWSDKQNSQLMELNVQVAEYSTDAHTLGAVEPDRGDKADPLKYR